MIVVGIDTHIATCDFYAVNSGGKVIGEGTFQTSAKAFRELVDKLNDKEIVLVIEQGPLTDWIRRILRPQGCRIAVSETRRNRWIAQDNVKNDRFDAKKLASLFLGGFIKEVVQRDERNEELLRLVMHHHDLIRQRTQVKNKLKAKFRQNGIRAAGRSVYNPSMRESWLGQIATNPHLVWPVEAAYAQLDLLDEQLDKTDGKIALVAKRYDVVRLLDKNFPGIGLVNAATFVALIDTPARFATVKRLWTYCGLGLDARSSGLRPGRPQLTRRGNRMLKYMLKQATITATKQSGPNRYQDWYHEALKKGREEHKAILTCARKLAKDMWLLWRKSEDEYVASAQT
jgi:transposase